MSVTDAADHEDSPQLKQLLDRVHDWAEQAGDAPAVPEEAAGAPAAPEEGNDDTAETFPRAHVEELRRESQRYRERAIKAEQLADKHAHRLHTELVRATGKLADPTDLPFDEAHLDDPDALAAAVEDLLTRKPHLASPHADR